MYSVDVSSDKCGTRDSDPDPLATAFAHHPAGSRRRVLSATPGARPALPRSFARLALIGALASIPFNSRLAQAQTANGPASQANAHDPMQMHLERFRQLLSSTQVSAPTARILAPTPPRGVFDLVEYPAPLGRNAAYVTPVRPGQRRPAIVWIAGGVDWGIGSSAWDPAPRENDQSARAFREAGVVLMLPSLRGSNLNPGHNEFFFGEVEDVIAAANWLATRPDVDPNRIYLGGHSTGGTLVLLVAEMSPRFRAVFAFGPVASVRTYGLPYLPRDAPPAELAVRVPSLYMHDIRSPTFVIEGGGTSGNSRSFAPLQQYVGNAPVRFVLVPDATHFSVLAPGTEAVARAILGDTGAVPHIEIAPRDIRIR